MRLTGAAERPSVPGRDSGYPTVPPTDPDLKIALIRFLGSDYSDARQTTLRLAHNFAALQTISDSEQPAQQFPEVALIWFVGPESLPYFPPGKTLYPASPSLQWVPWTSVPHLTGQ